MRRALSLILSALLFAAQLAGGAATFADSGEQYSLAENSEYGELHSPADNSEHSALADNSEYGELYALAESGDYSAFAEYSENAELYALAKSEYSALAEYSEYTIGVQAWNATLDRPSVMAPMLSGTARLSVQSGNMTAALAFVPAIISTVAVDGNSVIEVWPEPAGEPVPGTGNPGTVAEGENGATKTVTIALSTLNMPRIALRIAPMAPLELQYIWLKFDMATLLPIEDEPGGPADTDELEEALAEAKLLDADDYTEESYAALLDAIAAAEAVLAAGGPTQGDVDGALALLRAAVAALEEAGEGGTGEPGGSEAEARAKARGELLALIQNTGGVICAGLFSEESAAAYEAALKAATDALADDEAQAEDIEAAREALLEAVRGLEVRGEYGEYAELAALLLGVAELNGGDYTPASWRALSEAVEGAWGFIRAAIGGAGEEIGAKAGANTGSYAPLADVPVIIAAWVQAVSEALAALVPLPSGGAPDEISGGVYASGGAVIELIAEEMGEGGDAARAGFYVATGGASRVGTINLRLSYRLADVEGAEFSLAAGLAGKATLRVIDEDEGENDGENGGGGENEGEGVIVAPKPILPGYRTYSLYILANPGMTLELGAGEALLEAALALKPVAGGEGKPVSLLLTHLDIVHHDADGEGILAATSIAPSVASLAVRVFSRFDVNRDGAVTLVDVDIVRNLLGSAADGGEWATAAMGRCDLDGSGVIDIADLSLAIAKYESTVQ
jgi:hypothetical protein